jgi:hypothetical protein
MKGDTAKLMGFLAMKKKKYSNLRTIPFKKEHKKLIHKILQQKT